ncbi:MAG: methyltransferase domain-containing protein [Flavobacteriaceae bacterium]|nr:methyltransferase domain-containing protein [Flavobacteriaceae bacterium]
MSSEVSQWYASWFNTPYYHILYKDRDHKEARLFMDRLTAILKLDKNSHIMDLACGKGRHSIYLNQIGFEVTGVDLSKESINYAKQFENHRLHFDIHDMCLPYHSQFDAVFNLFTSFGYFEKEEDNLRTIEAIKSNLKPDGVAVIDFMNVDQVISQLVSEDSKEIDGILFRMNRVYKDGYIIKSIDFEDNGRKYAFEERVKAFRLDDFKDMFEQANVSIIDVFGDYHLNSFDPQKSDRLIMTFK